MSKKKAPDPLFVLRGCDGSVSALHFLDPSISWESLEDRQEVDSDEERLLGSSNKTKPRPLRPSEDESNGDDDEDEDHEESASYRSRSVSQTTGWLMSGTTNGEIRLWDLKKRRTVWKQSDDSPQNGSVLSLLPTQSRDGKPGVLSQHRDGMIRHWDVERGETTGSLALGLTPQSLPTQNMAFGKMSWLSPLLIQPFLLSNPHDQSILNPVGETIGPLIETKREEDEGKDEDGEKKFTSLLTKELKEWDLLHPSSSSSSSRDRGKHGIQISLSMDQDLGLVAAPSSDPAQVYNQRKETNDG